MRRSLPEAPPEIDRPDALPLGTRAAGRDERGAAGRDERGPPAGPGGRPRATRRGAARGRFPVELHM
jgi:hypothetical protein